MTFGVCCGLEMVPLAARAGFDFFETGVGGATRPADSDAAFAETLAAFRAAPLPCRALNVFVPGALKITGPSVDDAALERHVAIVCARAQQLGVRTIVFGSGGARNVPDGFERATAYEQIRRFARMAGTHAATHGITIAVEPLNTKECNILTTVAEAAQVVRAVDHPAVRLLVDCYHWALEKETPDAIVKNGPLFAHAHLATLPNRKAPGAEPYDFGPFFEALRTIGYTGGVWIEGQIPDPAADLPRALAAMKAA